MTMEEVEEDHNREGVVADLSCLNSLKSNEKMGLLSGLIAGSIHKGDPFFIVYPIQLGRNKPIWLKYSFSDESSEASAVFVQRIIRCLG